MTRYATKKMIQRIQKLCELKQPLDKQRIERAWQQLQTDNPELRNYKLIVEQGKFNYNPHTSAPVFPTDGGIYPFYVMPGWDNLTDITQDRYVVSPLFSVDNFLQFYQTSYGLDLLWSLAAEEAVIHQEKGNTDFIRIHLNNFALEMAEAGAWYLFIRRHTFITIPFPSQITLDGRGLLHDTTGPALVIGDNLYYFLDGLWVPDVLVAAPEQITPAMIQSETNIEIRRKMIDIYGIERFMRDSKARLINKETISGRTCWLYGLTVIGDEPYRMIKVTNATAEPDGTFKDYWLRVPPNFNKAIDALAWTFDLNREQYIQLTFES